MTDSWGIVLLVLGCPAVLGLLLMVLTSLEDNLHDPAPQRAASPSGNEHAAPRTVPGAAGR